MNANQLGQLMSAWVESVPTMPDAACRGTTWLADLDVRASRESIDAAVEMCLGCPAMVACAEWVDGLPADQKPAGVTAARLFDPTAYQTARAVLVGELKPEPSKEAAKPRAPRRPARQLLAVAEAAGGDGVTVREAAVALHSSDVTSRQVEIARQGLERLVRRGALVRVDRDGRTRYAAAQLEVAS